MLPCLGMYITSGATEIGAEAGVAILVVVGSCWKKDSSYGLQATSAESKRAEMA